MNRPEKYRKIFIELIFVIIFMISVPCIAADKDTKSSADKETSDAGEVSDLPSQELDELVPAPDSEGQATTEDTSNNKSNSAKNSDKKAKTDQDVKKLTPETIVPEMSSMSMTTGVGSGGETATDGIYSAPQAVDVVYTGAASYQIPIVVPPGRKNLQPNLSLAYNSYNGNGWLGVGWDLDLGTIQRSTKRGLNYNGNEFIAGSEELVPRTTDWGNNYYGAKIEGGFSKYYRNTSSGGWEVTSADGTKYFYGTTSASRIEYDNGNKIYTWCLDRVEDTNGNYMTITYQKPGTTGQIYPLKIEYTRNTGLDPTKSVEFALTENRMDHWSSFKSGYLIENNHLLTKITTKVGTQVVREYMLSYENNPVDKTSRLDSIEVTGYSTSGSKTLPLIELGWIDGGTGTFGNSQSTYVNGISGGLSFGDINGDGASDFIKYYALTKPYWSSPTVYAMPFLSEKDGTFTAKEIIELGVSSSVSVQLADVDGDGLADIVSTLNTSTVSAYISDGQGGFSAPITSNTEAGRIMATDLNGDGMADIIKHNLSNGRVYSYEATGGGTFNYIATHYGAGGAGEGLVRLADINGDGNPDLIKLNGLGTAYIYMNQGNGAFSSTSSTKSGLGYITNYIQFDDINGDGLSDILKNDATGNVTYYLSDGNGTFPLSGTAIASGISDKISLGDVNGDGLTDIVQSNETSNYTFLSNGAGGFREAIAAGGPGGAGSMYLADINGDGKADIIKNGGSCVCAGIAGSVGPEGHLVTPSNHLATITNEMGGTIGLFYSDSSEYIDNFMPFIVHPVSKIIANANDPDTANNIPLITNYTYSGGTFDYTTRGFWGFETVVQTNQDGTKIVTSHNVIDEYKKGRVVEVKVYEPGAQTWFKKTLNTWLYEPTGTADSKFVYLDQRETEEFIGAATTSVKVLENYSYVYNLSEKIYLLNTFTTSSETSPGETVTATTTYIKKGTWAWRVLEKRVDGSASGLVRRTNYAYDPKGNLLTESFYNNNGLSPVNTYTYYNEGNLQTSQDPEGNVTTMYYDTTKTYPVRIVYPNTQRLDNSTISHEVEMTYEQAYGRITDSRDENNNLTAYTYDGLGRLEQVNYPVADGGQVIYTYNDAAFPRSVQKRVKEGVSGAVTYIDSYVYYDGLGRPVQAVSNGATGLIVSRAYYDNMGRNYRTEGPFFYNGSLSYPLNPSLAMKFPYTEMEFNNQGRVDNIKSPDASYGSEVPAQTNTSYIDYDGLKVTLTDPDGKQKSEIKDYLGRIIFVKEYNEGSEYASTEYRYNAAGDLTDVYDNFNNHTSIIYDTLGRKRGMTDPDMGTWSYDYDKNGNLKTQTDANGHTITFYYDALNRPKSKIYNPSDANNPTVTFEYDNPASGKNGKGRLHYVTNGNSTTTNTEYDSMGRTISVAKTITGDSNTYTTSFTYDYSGKVITTTYPSQGGALTITNEYIEGTNLLEGVRNASYYYYATVSNYEPNGAIGRIVHGNGTETNYLYDGYSTRLKSLETKKNSTVLQKKEYRYSPAGDITRIIDSTNINNIITYNYEYDGLHRLKKEKIGSVETLNMAYNEIGNITSKTISAGSFVYTSSTTHKHAVDNITFSGETYDYGYDLNGNMTSGPDFTNLADIGTRTLEYNVDNMPYNITHSNGAITDLYYDGMGTRVKKSVDDGVTTVDTYYIGDHFEVKDTGTNTVATKFIFAGNLRIAQIEGGTLSYFHKDHLGSSTVITNASGTVLESTEYLPFGSQRSHSGVNTSKYKYTDQEFDAENGLYNYNARLYDPFIGRFISPDTIVPDPFNPQSLNRYSYVLNNPLIYVDPSGNQECTREDCGDLEEIVVNEPKLLPSSPPMHFEDPSDSSSGYSSTAPWDPWSGRISGELLAWIMQGNSYMVNFWGPVVGPYCFIPPQPFSGSGGGGGGSGGYSGGTTGGNVQQVTQFYSGGESFILNDDNAVYKLIQEAFRKATPEDSALKTDPYHVAAAAALGISIQDGDYFVIDSIDSRGYFGFSLLLQSNATYGGKTGIYEYIVPMNWGFFSGNPVMTHQTFIPGAPISGYPNNWGGKKYPPYFTVI